MTASCLGCSLCEKKNDITGVDILVFYWYFTLHFHKNSHLFFTFITAQFTVALIQLEGIIISSSLSFDLFRSAKQVLKFS